MQRRQFLATCLALTAALRWPRASVALLGLGTGGTRAVSAWAAAFPKGRFGGVPAAGILPQFVTPAVPGDYGIPTGTLPLWAYVSPHAPAAQKREGVRPLAPARALDRVALSGPPRQLVLVCALGGLLGSALAGWLADQADGRGIAVTVLASRPFAFEGIPARDAAQALAAALRVRHRVIVQDHGALEQRMPAPVRLLDLLRASDQCLRGAIMDCICRGHPRLVPGGPFRAGAIGLLSRASA
jgi:hypothetical protein